MTNGTEFPNSNTPLGQTEDWLDQILGTFAEDLIAYDKRMANAGAPPIRFVHKYLKKAKTAIGKHERQAVQAGQRKLLQSLVDNAPSEQHKEAHNDAYYFDIGWEAMKVLGELNRQYTTELLTGRPAAADTTKQSKVDDGKS